MIKDGGDVLHNCHISQTMVCWLDHSLGLPIGLEAPVMTPNSVTFLFDHRIAVWAEDEGIKAKGQAGFRKTFAQQIISLC